MLRAVRFAARFGFEIEPATFAAIRKLAPQIHQVSRERVRDELDEDADRRPGARSFPVARRNCLLHEVLPEIEAMKGVEQPPQFHPEGDVFLHTLCFCWRNCRIPVRPPWRGERYCTTWASRRHFVWRQTASASTGMWMWGSKWRKTICQRLRFSNDDTEQILALVDNHMRFAHAMRMSESTFKKFVRMPHFDEHLELHRLDCQASYGDLTTYEFTRDKMAALTPEAMRPAPLVTGDDLIAAGHEPGPRFKEILSAVEDGQLEGRLRDREEALQFVAREFPVPK